MCIIVYKPAEADLPEKDVLKICFSNHDDGAGYVKIGDECVVRKGLMTFDDFWEAYTAENFTVKDEIAIHFRTGTSGTNEPEFTHPFPITDNEDDLKLLHYTSKQIVLHNGIIGTGTKDLSDTMIFIKKVLFYLSYLLDDCHVIHAIENIAEGSKLLIVDEGTVHLTGDWDHDVDTGLMYSNTSYLYEYYCGDYYHHSRNNLDQAYDVIKKNGITTYVPRDVTGWDSYIRRQERNRREKEVSTYSYFWCSNCREHYHESDIIKLNGTTTTFGVGADCPTCYYKLTLQEVDY